MSEIIDLTKIVLVIANYTKCNFLANIFVRTVLTYLKIHHVNNCIQFSTLR